MSAIRRSFCCCRFVVYCYWESISVYVRSMLLYVHSSFAIILMGKREMVALLSLSSWCLVIVAWLFLVVTWICLHCVLMVFPDHTHLLFCICLLIC